MTKPNTKHDCASKKSSPAALLKHAGKWQGNDLEECLARVYDTRDNCGAVKQVVELEGVIDVLLAQLVDSKDCGFCINDWICLEDMGQPKEGKNRTLFERTHCRKNLELVYLNKDQWRIRLQQVIKSRTDRAQKEIEGKQ